ncbi:MAG TPA: acetyl-CoA acetyltransferase [Acidimicrobiales bacterium]|nr:acetyl-CoA acetyltransferase [Acidimicrobiales bacterium]
MSIDPRTPCLIGVAQQTWRDADFAPEPLDMWEEVSAAAAVDAGLTDLAALDSVQVVYTQSWQYDDPAGRLCERLQATPAHRFYSGIGGTTPQLLVNKTCESLLAGEYDLALITGAEALATKRKLRKTGAKAEWSHRHPEAPPFPFEDPFHPAEMAHQVWEAWLTFPIWDIARRAKLGIAPDDYRRQQGELLAPMTEVAAANPYAWFPTARSVDELITATKANRMVGYPYTKYMVSIMDVDMAAALVLATHETANDLGVPDDKRVYVRGWCYATDPPYVAEHVDMTRSPAMEAASREALTRAGVNVDDIAHFDLYSCFASSVNFAIDALGVRADDPRGPFTVTGGLPFAGGAGSDYVTHSIAAMVETLRAEPGALGLVSGVGMHMQKHAFGVYSTTPGDVRPPDPIPPAERAPIVDTYTGSVTVASYTAAHGRDGEAEWGLVVGDLPGDGGRCYGRVEDAGLLAAMEAEEWVGRSVELKTTDGNVNLVVG